LPRGEQRKVPKIKAGKCKRVGKVPTRVRTRHGRGNRKSERLGGVRPRRAEGFREPWARKRRAWENRNLKGHQAARFKTPSTL